MAAGLSTQAIADLLVSSERTVRTPVSNILGKLASPRALRRLFGRAITV
jgi:DNA-binding NarL/FixJ family response regulator